MKRRNMLELSAVAAGTALTGPLRAASPRRQDPSAGRLKILVAGAHPDDPETGCGGLMLRYVQAGHEVVAYYLTRGEAGIPGKSHAEAARIRTAELQKACKILGVRPLLGDQIDGATVVDAARYAAVRKMLDQEKPDVIVTHWPLDSHPDHRACSALIYDAWMRQGQKAALYYFEVMSGIQTQHFHPTDYCDITAVVEKKHEACFVHVSQKIRESYPNDHGRMERFRGMEHGCDFAEAYIHHEQSPRSWFPG